MNRIFSLFSVPLVLFSCSEKSDKGFNNQDEIEAPTPVVEIRKGDENLPGFAKINQSDCLSCHKDNSKFVGPSYAEIADKYSEQDIEILATKIIDGSKGTWGEVPMLPHPNLSKEESIEMVKYIMSLKKK